MPSAGWASGILFKEGLEFSARKYPAILVLDGNAGHALLNQSKGSFKGRKPRYLIRDESSLSGLAGIGSHNKLHFNSCFALGLARMER
jgi:hypothetical protein